MKKVFILGGVLLLMAFVSGCEVTPYGGVYGGVSGEYPSTYYGEYYNGYPVYPYYGYGHRAPYDRDHFWDRGRNVQRHQRFERHVGRRAGDDRH